jgi:hypothetical protein
MFWRVSIALVGLIACQTTGPGSVDFERQKMALSEKVSACDESANREIQPVVGSESCDAARAQLEQMSAQLPPPPKQAVQPPGTPGTPLNPLPAREPERPLPP